MVERKFAAAMTNGPVNASAGTEFFPERMADNRLLVDRADR